MNICHVESTICQNFNKAKFHENLDCPLHGADLVPGESCNGLDGVRKMFVEHKDSTVFQRYEVHLQQQVGIQKAVWHIFQNNHCFAVVEILFQFEIVKSPVFSHRENFSLKIEKNPYLHTAPD